LTSGTSQWSHRRDNAQKKLQNYIVVWIHGGALIMGSRRWISDSIKSMVLGAGYVLVSIDYRLAAESELLSAIQDVEDSFRWIRTDGAAQFHGHASKIAVMGGSAGGYLTLVTGYRVKPRPAALVSFWGYGDRRLVQHAEPACASSAAPDEQRGGASPGQR